MAKTRVGTTVGGVEPYSSAGLDRSTKDFRKNRSARDRMLGLNVSGTPGAQRINPMMPGVPMGAVNPNYGGIGDKARWYEGMANQSFDPNTEARQQGLVDLNRSSGGAQLAYQDVPGAESAARIALLQQVGGLRGAANAGLMDRFVSGSSLTRTADDSPERTAQLDKLAAIRAGEKQRKAHKLGDINDPTSTAARMAARGALKLSQRQQRMAGPTDEQRLMTAAANGSRPAMAMLGMLAEGNKAVNVEGLRGKNAMEVVKAQGEFDKSLAEIRAGGDETVAGIGAEADKYRVDATTSLGEAKLKSEQEIAGRSYDLQEKGVDATVADAAARREHEQKILGLKEEELASNERQFNEQTKANEEIAQRAHELQLRGVAAQESEALAEREYRQGQLDIEKKTLEYAQSPEGVKNRILGNIDPSGNQGAQGALSTMFGGAGSAAPLMPTAPPMPSGTEGLEGTELRDELRDRGFGKDDILKMLRRKNPSATWDHPDGWGSMGSRVMDLRFGGLPLLRRTFDIMTAP